MMMIKEEEDAEAVERNNEVAERETYHSAVQRFLVSYPSVNRSDLDRLLARHIDAATGGFMDGTRTRWDFSGSFYFVSTVVSTIGRQTFPFIHIR